MTERTWCKPQELFSAFDETVPKDHLAICISEVAVGVTNTGSSCFKREFAKHLPTERLKAKVSACQHRLRDDRSVMWIQWPAEPIVSAGPRRVPRLRP